MLNQQLSNLFLALLAGSVESVLTMLVKARAGACLQKQLHHCCVAAGRGLRG